MSDQDIDQPGEFTDQFAERFHQNRREHGGEIDRLNPDQLDRLTEEERVEAGVDAYDPDEVPPATDTPPLTQDVRQTDRTRRNRPRSAARRTRARYTPSTRTTRSRPPGTTTEEKGTWAATAGNGIGRLPTGLGPHLSH